MLYKFMYFHFKMYLRGHFYLFFFICCLDHSVQLLARWIITARFFFFSFQVSINVQTSELQYSGHESSNAGTSQPWSSFQAVSNHLCLLQTLSEFCLVWQNTLVTEFLKEAPWGSGKNQRVCNLRQVLLFQKLISHTDSVKCKCTYRRRYWKKHRLNLLKFSI